MKHFRIVPIILFFAFTGILQAGQRASGWCQQGNTAVTFSGFPGSGTTPKVQGSFPGCTVTVYQAGTTTLATIYSDANNTPKSNPFTADGNGYWFFYGTPAHYDAALSGTGFTSYTVGDVILQDVTGSNGGSLINYTAPVTGAVSRTVAAKLSDTISVLDFGAKCDGVTDDHAALQSAINTAISSQKMLTTPAGVCSYSTTLNLNVVNIGVHLRGNGNLGSGNSNWLYTGTGTSVLAKNAVGNGYIYNLNIEGVSFDSSGAATYGLEAYTLSEFFLKDTYFGPLYQSSGTMQTGIYCGGGCNIGTFEHTIISNTSSHAVVLINPSALNFRDDDFFAIRGAHFAMNGGIAGVIVRDGWHEEGNVGLLLDDSLSVDAMYVQKLVFEGDTFLFDGSSQTLYPDQIAMRTNFSGSKQVQVRGIAFRDCRMDWAYGLTNTKYPFQINWPAVPSFGSLFSAELSAINLNGMQNTGAYFNVTGTTLATQNQVVLSFRNITAVDQTNAAFFREMNGFASYQHIRQVNDGLNFGRNSNHYGLTAAFHDNDAANGGKTIVGYFAGPNQGAYGLNYFYDGNGNTMYLNDNAGTSYQPNYGTRFLSGSGFARWWTFVQGTESGSNSGSNYTLNRYSDTGVYLDTPFAINRASGQVQVGLGGISVTGSSGLTIIKNVTGTSGACTMTYTSGLLTASTCP